MNAYLQYCSVFQVDWIVCVVKCTVPFYVGDLFLFCHISDLFGLIIQRIQQLSPLMTNT